MTSLFQVGCDVINRDDWSFETSGGLLSGGFFLGGRLVMVLNLFLGKNCQNMHKLMEKYRGSTQKELPKLIFVYKNKHRIFALLQLLKHAAHTTFPPKQPAQTAQMCIAVASEPTYSVPNHSKPIRGKGDPPS